QPCLAHHVFDGVSQPSLFEQTKKIRYSSGCEVDEVPAEDSHDLSGNEDDSVSCNMRVDNSGIELMGEGRRTAPVLVGGDKCKQFEANGGKLFTTHQVFEEIPHPPMVHNFAQCRDVAGATGHLHHAHQLLDEMPYSAQIVQEGSGLEPVAFDQHRTGVQPRWLVPAV
ncbi:hypothetical protein U1Q18_049236, partial [Sarracenia purpurea var. burkii]